MNLSFLESIGKSESATTDSANRQKNSDPEWFVSLPIRWKRYCADPKLFSKDEMQKLFAEVKAARPVVHGCLTRIDLALATGKHPDAARLSARRCEYVDWMIATAHPAIMKAYFACDSELQKLYAVNNAGGDLQTYYSLVGQAAALRLGMQLFLAQREQPYDDLDTTIAGIKNRMSAFAIERAIEAERTALAEDQFARCMRHANERSDKWRADRLEKELLNRQVKAKAAEEKQQAQERAKAKIAATESGLVSIPSSSSPYKR